MNGAVNELLQGTLVWRPAFAPPLILGAALALGILALVAAARLVRERPVLATALLLMRVAVIAAIALILFGPSAIPPTAEEPVKPALAILVDTSQSMLVEDCDSRSRVRYAAERWLSQETLERLGRTHRVGLFAFDDTVRALPAG